jgi:hypothetical protein
MVQTITPEDEKAEVEEERATNRVRDQGQEDGLFRACMDAIRTSHTKGQRLRTVMIAAGLLTDRACYAEMLGQFYVCTAALERRLRAVSGDSLAVRAAKSLGYSFGAGYEADLEALLGEKWRTKVEEMTSEPAHRYVARLEHAGDAELCGALFILWGPLVIGGGAALKPRVAKAFGQEATHVFEQVGVTMHRTVPVSWPAGARALCAHALVVLPEQVVGPARGQRRAQFITCFDGLLQPGQQQPQLADEVVAAARSFMELNNELMLSVRARPYWAVPMYGCMAASAVALVSQVVARLF